MPSTPSSSRCTPSRASRRTPRGGAPRLRGAVLPIAAAAAVVLAACTAPADDAPSADDMDWTLSSEASGFLETATHPEVVRYLEQAAAVHPALHLTHMGYTNEGRVLPLLIAGSGIAFDTASAASEAEGPAGSRMGLPGTDRALAAEVRRAAEESGRPVIYLQGGIHSGEAAGKEGLLRLVRALAHGERGELLDDLILLIGPVYNADGNADRDLRNRPRQHGPLAGMGTRPNAQGLDLNRDQMKLDSPEARSLAGLMTDYDPHVLVDLHTTNGTQHAYHLTYSPGLHPATPEVLDNLLRDELLPAVTERIEQEHGWHYWHYGNVSTRGGVRGWYTFDHRPRFVTNYTGLRNRLGILSEAYSYATFHERVLASERFVDEILLWSRDNAGRIVETVRAEDARDLRGQSLPVRAAFAAEAPEHPVLMGETTEETHPWSGQTVLRRLDVVREDPMPAWVAFEGTQFATVPHAYLLPADLADVVNRLRAHGVRVEEADPGASALEALETAGVSARQLERFGVVALDRAAQPFQGRNEVAVEGIWVGLDGALGTDAADPTAEGGWHVVPMDQPLARLAVLLLEPRADDGFVNWGLMDDWLQQGSDAPLLRVVPGG